MTVFAAVSAQTRRVDVPSTAPDGRFTDHGDGTISDAATGLMSKQCAEGLSGVGCAVGSAEAKGWQLALQVATDSGFAGRADWRLANVNELESLLERRCFSPAINATYFPNTPASAFWSSSAYVQGSFDAWYVEFGYGDVRNGSKISANYVRLVRVDQ